MTEQRVEGIVLHALPYQDHHHILTIFSKEKGILKLFAPKGKRNSIAHAQPLTRAQFIYTEKANSTLHRLREVSLIDQHEGLRESYEQLQLGCAFAQAVHSTQMQGKEAPHLYQLLATFLAAAAKPAANANALLTSFLLKTLKHEGLFHPENLPFEGQEEASQLLELTALRSIKKINELTISKDLKEKTVNYFKESTSYV